MQKRLLTEAEFTFKKAVEIAQSNETASARAKQLQSPKSSSDGEPAGQVLDLDRDLVIVVRGHCP